jgi:hypothetical protein
MKNLFCFAIATAMLVGLGSTAEASIFYDNIGVNDGNDDRLSDQSLGWFVVDGTASRPNADTIVAGDKIRGLIRMDLVNTVNPNDTLWAAYEFVIASVSDSDTSDGIANDTVTFANGDVMSWLNGSGSGGQSIDTTALNTGSSANASFVLLETGSGGTALDFNAVFREGEALYKDSNKTTAAFDGWNALITGAISKPSDAYGLTNGLVNLGSFNAVGGVSGGVDFANIEGGLSVTSWDATKLSKSWGPSLTGLGQLDPTKLGIGSEIFISGGFVTGAFTQQSNRGFDFVDRGEFFINPVPEPSTIAIWAALGLGGCGFVARRRMKAKKA